MVSIMIPSQRQAVQNPKVFEMRQSVKLKVKLPTHFS